MATALASGWVRQGVTRPEQIHISDPSPAAREQCLKGMPGCQVTDSNTEVVAQADVLILAVKPGLATQVLAESAASLRPQTLVVSIAAGVQLQDLEQAIPQARIIRVMPNTPCLVGDCAAGFSLGRHATAEDSETLRSLLTAVGVAFEVPEPLLDAVTGLSGSGPAYVFTIIEALADAGVAEGLPRGTAAALAAHTVRGAAEMVIRTGEHPSLLREKVASPGGTTIAGLAALERGGLRAALLDAVEAAAIRSRQLANR